MLQQPFTMLQTCCIFLLLCCLSANTNAQTYEFTTILPLDKLLEEKENDTLAAFFPLVDKNENTTYYNDRMFTYSFFDKKRDRKEVWYYDKKLQKPLEDDFSYQYDFPDTVITYDPATYEEQIKIVTFCEWTYFIKTYGVRHTLTYDAAKQQINCEISALAPILKRHSDSYKIDYNVAAWTALADTQRYENPSLSDTALTWAKMAKIYFKTNEFERKNTDTNFVNLLYNDIKQGKWRVYNYDLDTQEQLLSKMALDSILYTPPETAYTLDAITRQYSNVATGKKGFDISDCTHLRLNIIYFLMQNVFV
jgi:hypothetical protein